jgi:hypothetical protein
LSQLLLVFIGGPLEKSAQQALFDDTFDTSLWPAGNDTASTAVGARITSANSAFRISACHGVIFSSFSHSERNVADRPMT